MAETPGIEQRDPVEVLAAEFIDSARRGEYPSIEEYAESHPDVAEEIRDLFPTIVAMEKLKIRREASTDGRASLGPVKLEQLGDYRIIREIGRGGMGIVYEAEQESLGRHVAVKVMPRQSLLDAKQLDRFRREASIAAKLHHTNIVPVFGVGEQDGFNYYVMQHIQGVGLDVVIDKLQKRDPSDNSTVEIDGVRLPDLADGKKTQTVSTDTISLRTDSRFKAVARIGLQVAEALEYAHAQGTLHRDIKPANLLLDNQGVVWVADFGLAKAIQQEAMTVTRGITGTLRYMAPEQFEGKSDVRSDICAFGLTLYELLTLQPAYADSDQSRLIKQVARSEPTPPRKVVRSIPPDLNTIVMKSIARDPGHRYQTASEMADDLRCFLEDRPILSRRVTQAERMWRWCRRNPAVASLSAAALVLLVMVAVVASVGFVQTRDALADAKIEREKAEATTQLAADVLDQIFKQFAPRPSVSSSLDESDSSDTYEVSVQPVLSKETAAALESLLAFYDALAEQGGDEATFVRKSADANRRVGDIQQTLGHFEDAKTAYQRAIEKFETLDSDQKNLALTLEIASIHNEVGNIDRNLNSRKDVRRAHQRALTMLEGTGSKSPAVTYEIARTCFYLGRRMRPGRDGGDGPGRHRGPPHRSGDGSPDGPPEHRAPRNSQSPRNPRSGQRGPQFSADIQWSYMMRATKLLDSLIQKQANNPDYRHLMALCFLEMSQGPGELRPDEAPSPKEAREKATAMIRDLVKDYPESPEYRYELSEVYAAVDPHDLSNNDADNGTTIENLKKALDISLKLVSEHPNVPKYASDQVHIFHKLAHIQRRYENGREAERNLRAALTVQEGLAKRFPGVAQYAMWHARIAQSLAETIHRTNEDEARELIETAIKILDHQIEAQTKPPGNQMYEGYQSAAHTLRRIGEEQRADELMEIIQHLRPGGPGGRGPGHRGPGGPDHRGDRQGPPRRGDRDFNGPPPPDGPRRNGPGRPRPDEDAQP